MPRPPINIKESMITNGKYFLIGQLQAEHVGTDFLAVVAVAGVLAGVWAGVDI